MQADECSNCGNPLRPERPRKPCNWPERVAAEATLREETARRIAEAKAAREAAETGRMLAVVIVAWIVTVAFGIPVLVYLAKH